MSEPEPAPIPPEDANPAGEQAPKKLRSKRSMRPLGGKKKKATDSSPPPSSSELAAAKARFRARQGAHVEETHALNRRWRVRVIRWSFMAAITGLLALYRFGVGFGDPPPLPPPNLGDPAPVIGADAVFGAELEVKAAYLAPLNGLAIGSEAARETQRDYALDQRLPIEIANMIGMHFRLIPPGSFTMGSPASQVGRSSDEPEHVKVINRPFYMGSCEVTQGQYERVMGENPSFFKKNGPNAAVEEVTWRNCVAFARALCELEGLPVGTYRLAFEREWEYACRAGTQTAFCSGDTRESLLPFADFAWNNDGGTVQVGQRAPNAWGLFDMHGNVWEWCADRFYAYDGSSVDSLNRNIRGGNWRVPYLDCRSASRYRLPPDSLGNICGFRIVRLIPKLPGETD
jgi:formylglycine-generating enzyme required for sulfatase activity